MASIDQKIVSMVFDNSRFRGAVDSTLGMLKKLEGALKLDKAANGFDKLGASAKKVDLNDLGGKIDALVGRFTGLQGVGTGALLAIGNAAVQAGQKIMSSMTQATRDGFAEYETKMGSIQTILANTMKHGTTLADVSKSLSNLNDYADKTIYSFGDMTRNIGLFTNAGLKLETSTSMIKGFSNAAAASGTNAQGAASAAYQLSQALSAGTIRLMDWRSLTNVGMGNKNMQEGVIAIATAMKRLNKDSAAAAMKDFNGSLEKGWLSADVMSNYLQIMAGDMDAAKMKALGLSDAQIKNFQTQQKVAEEAATKVRTFSQLMGTMAEAAGSGWATTFELLLGDFDEATNLFTGINDAIGPIIQASTDARNDMIRGWRDGGGRDAVIAGFSNIWQTVSGIIKPIQEAFGNIFPKNGPAGLVAISKGFESLTAKFKVSEQAANGIKMVATAVAVVFRVLGQAAMFVVDSFVQYARVAGALFELISSLISPIAGVAAALLGIGDNAGAKNIDGLFDTLKRLREGGIDTLVKSIDNVTNSMGGWGEAMKGVEQWARQTDVLGKAGEWMAKQWEGLGQQFGKLSAALPGVMSQIGAFFSGVPAHLKGFGEAFGRVFQGIKQWFSDLTKGTGDFASKVKEAITGFVNFFRDAMKGMDPMLLMSMLNTAVFFGIAKKITGLFKSGGSIKESIIGALEGVTGVMETIQEKLQPNKLRDIGMAIILVAGAFAIMASIDGSKLQTAAAGMAIAVGALAAVLGVMKLVSMGDGIGGFTSLAFSLMLLGGAMLILGLAMKGFAALSWEEIGKGLVGVTGALLVLGAAAGMLRASSANMIIGGIGLTIMAGALLLMSAAVLAFGSIPFDTVVQGLASLGLVLAGLSVFILATGGGQNLMTVGAGMVLLAASIGLIVGAVLVLGTVPFPIIAQGLVSLGIILGGLGALMVALQGQIQGAAVILALAFGLNMLVAPLITLGLLPWGVLAQGLFGIGAALFIFAGAMKLITPADALGVLAVSAALILLSAGLAILGSMSLESLGMAILGLVVALVALGVAGAVIGPLAPALLMLGAAIAVISISLAIAAGAFVLFGIGLVGIGAGAAGAAAGLTVLGMAMVMLAPYGLQIASMAVAFGLLGVAMIAAGAGAVMLGAGFMMLGIGLTLVAAAAGPGIIGLTALANAAADLIGKAPALAIMAATFTGLGLGLTAMGIGAAAAAVGALALSVAMIAVNMVAPLVAGAIDQIGSALQRAAGDGSAAALATALAALAAALLPIGPAMLLAAGGAIAMVASLAAVAAASAALAAAFLALGPAATAMATALTTALTGMGAAAQAGTVVIVAALATLAPAVAAAAVAVTASSAQMTAAFTGMGMQSAAAVVGGTAMIAAALAPLPPLVLATAAAVVAASNMLVMAFTLMGSRAAAAINASGATIRSALASIAASAGAAAVQVGHQIIAGMVRGLANSGAVVAAARNVANQALAAAKGALGIHSPSKEFEAIGEYVNEGFARGLSGITKAKNPVDEEFENMEERIANALSSIRDRIGKAQENVNKYSKSPKKYRKELAEARKELADAKAAEAMANRASASLRSMWSKEGAQLKKMRDDYDKMKEEVDDAKQDYEDAIRKRDDAIKSYAEKYGDLPSMDKETTYDSYIKNMQEVTEKTKNYDELLESLRKKGLNDKIYKQLLDSGIEMLPFLEDIVLSGDNAIKNLNNMSDELDKISSGLGKKAGNNLYQSGVDAAKGLYEGLLSKRSDLAKAIEDLTSTIVKRIKSDLQIHSPSRVLMKLGTHAGVGLAKGLAGTAPDIRRAATFIGDQTQDAVDREFGKITTPLSDIFDGDPVIRPVLDLSKVESGAAAINAMLASGRVAVDASVRAAAGALRTVNSRESQDDTPVSSGSTVIMNQYNSSPKALNHGEIYRNTNNQLSRIRKALE